MATLDLVSTFVNQLNDMESELRFHNLGNLVRIGQVKGYISKGRIEHTSSHIIHLTTLSGRAWILRIESCQSSKRCLPFCHTICITAQFILHAVNLFLFNTRCLCQDLHLHLRRNERNTIFRQIIEIPSYIRRRHIDILHQLSLHLIDHQSVAEGLTHLLSHLRDALLTVFLQFLPTTNALYPVIDDSVNLLHDLRLRHLHTVYGSLMQIEFLQGELLRNGTIRITCPSNALLFSLQTHSLHL